MGFYEIAPPLSDIETDHLYVLTVPLRALPDMYKHLELGYQAFVGLYIIDISMQNNIDLRWSATMIL